MLGQQEIDTGKVRSIPLAKHNEVEELDDEIRRSDLMESSSGLLSSTVVLVKKKNGSTKFCIDYTKLNEVAEKDSYLLPRTEDTLDTLAGTNWSSTFDI